MKRYRILHLHTGGCNGCDVEIVSAIITGLKRGYEFKLVHNPDEADIIVSTGPLTEGIANNALEIIKRIRGKPLVAVGSCCLSGCMFVGKGSYAIRGPIGRYAKIYIHVTGCPPNPESILEAFIEASRSLK